jgi:hypothetical protein
MKFWTNVCVVLGYAWLIFGGAIIFIGIVGTWMKEGFSGVQGLLSPFNVINWLVTVIILAPGIGLLILSEKLRQKKT